MLSTGFVKNRNSREQSHEQQVINNTVLFIPNYHPYKNCFVEGKFEIISSIGTESEKDHCETHQIYLFIPVA